jgi:hypothetical protein
MSLITQCPACQTLFKVVADQLQVSQGWVRCGQCQNVFDANAHVYKQPLPEAEPPPEPVPTQSAENPASPSPEFPPFEPADPVFSAVDVDLSSPLPSFEHPADQASFDATPQDPTPPFQPEPSAALNVELNDKPLSFLRKPPKRGRRASPWERAGLVLIIVMLSGGLGVQFAAHEHDLIAAYEPRLKPWLEDFCDAMKCRVRSLRQIDSVLIESSSFTKINQDVFALNFSLKNTSAVPLALPALELSLTDAHDQALLRKVLREKDLNLHANTLAPGAQMTGSVMVSLVNGDMSDRIAGYRILAFYP